MKFFVSPAKLWSLIREKEKYVLKVPKRDREWYFSPEGEDAYSQADTLGKRVAFFHEYLIRVIKGKSEKESYKMALLLAVGISKSRLSYAGYPSIINEEENPILSYYKENGVFSTTAFLSVICGRERPDTLSNPKEIPYENLTYCSGGEMSDQYRLERLIILIGESENEQKLVAPFIHNLNDKEVR